MKRKSISYSQSTEIMSD